MNLTVMTNIQRIWNTGDFQLWYSPGQPGGFEQTQRFREETGATAVVELRWLHHDREVRCPFPATVLPDRSGVVLMDEWHFQGAPMEGPEPYQRHLRVWNPDGSERLRIFPPRIDDHSRPEESWIEEPRDFAHRGIPFGTPASDGYRHMVVEFDWTTGKLLRWINAAPWLTY